ncbi:DNA-binding response regulator [Verrucomicrobia bacterium LW23]|nr:DNA-binding response regulator [Verrucomicrobia bacterium LW23]
MIPNKLISIHIADDHPVVRTGVRLIVQSAPDCAFLCDTADAASTLAAVEKHRPDVLVLDLWMGGNDGFELIRSISIASPGTRILVYSSADERVMGPRALRAGAAGFVLKSCGLDELLQAIRTVAAGRRAVSPALMDELMEAGLQSGNPTAAPRRKVPELAVLTDRELQVLRLIGSGQPTSKIAQVLNISLKTVGAHRENLKNKLHVANGAELAERAVSLVNQRMF